MKLRSPTTSNSLTAAHVGSDQTKEASTQENYVVTRMIIIRPHLSVPRRKRANTMTKTRIRTCHYAYRNHISNRAPVVSSMNSGTPHKKRITGCSVTGWLCACTHGKAEPWSLLTKRSILRREKQEPKGSTLRQGRRDQNTRTRHRPQRIGVEM